jgi:uncharacterized protein YjbI with pentapeptide repeats/pSer/pThr/pTyr-binding forkhead associated (FHA) protein
MNESSANWIAIVTFYDESGSQNHQRDPEPYILSTKEATFIGRSNDCQIILRPKYTTASRYHAKIEQVSFEGKLVWQVCDLGTPNGTFVNDQKIKGCQRLQSGDYLTLGKPRGANFIFEWNSREIEELNEIFRKKHPYDETVVPQMESFESQDEKTQFFPKSSSKVEVGGRPVEESSVEAERSIIDFRADKATISGNRNFINYPTQILAKGLLAFISVLILSFLIYRILGFSEAQKNEDASLKSYIDSISKLLLDKKLSSLSLNDPSARNARESANGQTLTTLKNLDGQTKGALLRFLHGSKLIKIQSQKLGEEWLSNKNIVSNKGKIQLFDQDLNRKELIYLSQTKIQGNNIDSLPVFLMRKNEFDQRKSKGAIQECANPTQMNKKISNCSWVLEFASQSYEEPFLTPIQLSGADLTGVVLKDAPLDGINLEGAYMSLQECKPSFSGNFFEVNFYKKPMHWLSNHQCRADLSGAGLQNARLFRSVLIGANLSNGKLDHADLREADLRGANLTGVSWKGAILTGACYFEEDWQKYFPEKGTDGQPFNPIAEGMKPISNRKTDFNNPHSFQECKARI